MFHALISEVLGWQVAVYPLIAVALAIEGDFVLFGVMLGLFQGALDPFWGLLAAIAGAFLGDIAWYRLGIFVGKHPRSKAARFIERITAPLDARLRKHPARILFLSKLTYGLHRPILIRFGMLGMTQRRLLNADVPAAFFWIATIGLLAWFAHESLLPVAQYLRYFELALLVAFAGFVLIQAIFASIVGSFLGRKKGD